jgi:hypothetical protein
MTVTILRYAVLSFIFGSANIAVAYEIQARAQGWPIGRWLTGEGATTKTLAVASMIASLVIAFLRLHWYSPIVVIGVGFIFGLVATRLLKSTVQYLAILGTLLGWALLIFVA